MPFFSRLWAALAVHLLVALGLSAIGMLDALVERPIDWRVVGALVAYTFLVLTLYHLMLRRTGRSLDLRLRALATTYLLLAAIVGGSRLLFDTSGLSHYAAPAVLAVLLLGPLVRQTHALAIHLVAVALVAPLIRFQPGMVLVPLAAGWMAALLLQPGCGGLRLLLAAGAGALAGAAALVGLDLFSPYGLDTSLTLEGDLVGLLIGTLGAGVVAALLLVPASLLYGAVPRSKLSRLRDLEHPVLRDLADKAPGTFQHTLAVANMAEKVALDIDADDELVRVGAYYHDIGKMRDPDYFAENQQDGNPHDRLAPRDSAAKLRQHTENGVIIARGANLPERIVDFIVEHHGRSTMDFFYDKARQTAEGEVNAEVFRYRGRNPTSRETAVLMIADAVEAASRTLDRPDRERIAQLVRRILFDKLLRGYLDDSGLSSRDLKRMGRSLMRILGAQFHVRIEYPWQRPQSARTSSANRIATPIGGLPAVAGEKPAEQPAGRTAEQDHS